MLINNISRCAELSVHLEMVLLFALFCFAAFLTLLQLLRWQTSLRFLPLQFCQLGFHLDDQLLEPLLALLAGMGVDIAGVLFAVDPCGRVAALPQVRPFLRDASGARPALLARDRLEVGHARLFALAGDSFLPRRRAALRQRSFADAAVDVSCGLPLHIVGDVSVDVQRSRRRHMTQHGGEGLDVHAALERQRCVGMARVMEADVRQASLLEQYFQSAVGRVRVHGQLRADRLREDPLAHCPLLSLPQELHDALGKDDGAGTLAGLGRP